MMRDPMDLAREMLRAFKGEQYAFGLNVLPRVGVMTAEMGQRALLVGRTESTWLQPGLAMIEKSLAAAGVRVLKVLPGAAPNAPFEDVFRIRDAILDLAPDVVVSVEGGSGIDACKAAATLATFHDQDVALEELFGVGLVTPLCVRTGRRVLPVVAVMTAAGAAAHLTRYSNITEMASGQKKLIIDDALVPPRAVFDYALTASAPGALTLDGALDGMSHCLEVYLGAKGDNVERIESVALAGMELILLGLQELEGQRGNLCAREKIGLGTDLGGYAIMIGGTNGPHLNSFSMVRQVSHGRACAVLNPYYLAYFAPAVEERVRKVGALYARRGYLAAPLDGLTGSDLGRTVAQGMLAFNRAIGFPVSLKEIPGMDRSVLDRALAAAKNPQLASKLQNMPLPMTPETVDREMRAILEAAWQGNVNIRVAAG